MCSEDKEWHMPAAAKWVCVLLRAPYRDERRSVRLFRTICYNLLKKMSVPLWFAHRTEIVNWFPLYLTCSSLLFDLARFFFPSATWVRNRTLKVCYSTGLILHFPSSDYASNFYVLWNTVFDQYMSDFRRYFERDNPFEPGGVVIDVGAHIGTFSVPLCARFPGVRVLAFEPDPTNFQCLEKSIAANAFSPETIMTQQAAVYSHSGELSFTVGATTTTGSIEGAGFFLENADGERIVVQAVSLDHILDSSGIDSCALLKLDCEGSEYAIFENLSDETLCRIERLVMEIHPTKEKSPAMLVDLLEARGFDVKGHAREDGGWEAFCIRKKGVLSGV